MYVAQKKRDFFHFGPQATLHLLSNVKESGPS